MIPRIIYTHHSRSCVVHRETNGAMYSVGGLPAVLLPHLKKLESESQRKSLMDTRSSGCRQTHQGIQLGVGVSPRWGKEYKHTQVLLPLLVSVVEELDGTHLWQRHLMTSEMIPRKGLNNQPIPAFDFTTSGCKKAGMNPTEDAEGKPANDMDVEFFSIEGRVDSVSKDLLAVRESMDGIKSSASPFHVHNNAFIGLNYVPSVGGRHAPPPAVAEILRCSSCVQTCPTCSQDGGCAKCLLCPLHLGAKDKTDTVAIFHQSSKTVSKNKVYLLIGDEAFQMSGGLCIRFNAKETLHGTWAPEKIDPIKNHWFSLEIVGQ
jgi:hypothetical protein